MALVTVTQAAAILGVSDDTVRRRVETGELPSLRDEVGCLLVDLPDDYADARAVTTSPRAQVEQRPTFIVETVHLRNLLEEREARVADLEAAVESLSAELRHQREVGGHSSVRERELIRVVQQGQILHAQALGLPVRTVDGRLSMAAPASPAVGEAGDGAPAPAAPPWWRRRRNRTIRAVRA
jgi:excisionase family DNA binding protein